MGTSGRSITLALTAISCLGRNYLTHKFGKRSSRSVYASCRFLYLNHPLLKWRVLQLRNRILRACSWFPIYNEPLSPQRRYGDAFCTTLAAGGPCSSNCDAKAQCGPNAPAGEEECPLNVCCSQFGFCGTTQDFCGEGCTSNCNPANPAQCGSDAQTALTKRIGYYEGWAAARSCDAWSPSNINVASLTHVNFAFAYISSSFEVVEMTAGDSKLWTETTALKSQNPSLKVFLSIGGWTFNNAPTAGIFSSLVASEANTNVFIKSVLGVMNTYGFDGIDIDWEYPVAEDRGGAKGDKENYVTFIKAVKAAFIPFNYELSFTAPTSYWYLQNYDLPGMLADDGADWVNVMTYDLHGVWDSPADYIGSIVLAHTNLTEIMDAFQLYANVGIDPSKMVMGIGFYGRSFELVSDQCTTPGCPFAGAAPAGPCSANAGTLMFTEIEDIISSVGTNALVFDEEAAVKYLVYNEFIDWVSYDDQQTLGMKLQYANSICLIGTMIWSVDQDDTAYTALSALYGDVTDNNSTDQITGNQCTYTDCGGSCGSETLLGLLESNPVTLETCTGVGKDFVSICCPVGDAPQSCTWRGKPTSDGICDGTCLPGEILMGLSNIGDATGGPTLTIDGVTLPELSCLIGQEALCCRTDQDTSSFCTATACGFTTCPSGSTAHGSSLSISGGLTTCSSGDGATLCCQDQIGLTNCAWHGTPPNCLDNACPVGQTVIYNDYQGDASSSCVGNDRKFCCDTPNDAAFSPISPLDVFPAGEIEVITFAVDFDDNQGTSDDTQTGAGSSGIDGDGMEEDSPFSSVFISSPNAASVSSLDVESDWAITNCDPASDQSQSVLAYCTCPIEDEDCGCGHVFIGQANDTIVKLPDTCGLGPYARVVSLEPHPDQTVLSADHAARKRNTDPVYSLVFDYLFTDIAEENGPVYMRADMTDLPGYWDSVVDSTPDSTTDPLRKRDLNFHSPRGLEKRWTGSFANWLSKLNTLTKGDSISRNYHWSDTYTIFHQEEACPNFQSSLDISVTGFASVNSQFGYYLEVKIVPPSIQQAYVYFKAGAGAEAAFTITGVASASWDSGRYELINFGFPGLYYPGLLTLGPSLHLYGELSGQLSLSGTYKTSVMYNFPPLDLSFGKQDSNAGQSNFGTAVQPTNNFGTVDYNVGWNVELTGSADVHLVPSLQLGISILGGSLLDGQVFVEADLFAGLSISGSVSNSVAPNFCVTPVYGVNLNAGLTGSVLFWESGPISTTFYSVQSDLGSGCFNSIDEPTASDSSSSKKRTSLEAFAGQPLAYSASVGERFSLEPSARTVHPTSSWERPGLRGETELDKRAIPFLPGNLFCPAVDSDISADSSNCDPYAGDSPGLSRRALDEEELLWEGYFIPTLNNTDIGSYVSKEAELYHTLSKRAKDGASLMSCTGGFTIPIAVYQSLNVNGYFDLASPTTLSGNVKGYSIPPYYTTKTTKGLPALTATRNGAVIYGREHVYEQSMSSLFIDYLQQFENVWTDGSGDDFCHWVLHNLFTTPAYSSGTKPVNEQIGDCYPSQANSKSAGIPVLEQRANEYKQSAIYFPEFAQDSALSKTPGIISTSTFTGDCPTAQVATLRALAVITPFMNSLVAQNAFTRNHDCIRGVYQTWFTEYKVNSIGVAPAGGIPTVTEFIDEYNSWVKTIVQGIQPAVVAEMGRLIPLFKGNAQTDPMRSSRIGPTSIPPYPPASLGNQTITWSVPPRFPWKTLTQVLKNTATGDVVGIDTVTMADLTTLMNK
ncbi:hypothetical protein FB45DRAFT_1056011 [Roridomyces roridus]|uniref:Chitinase n=1 Tax=Roridomyces roridus TaxID=1738132 RepID=A0AAD7C1V9_9AGAR|nr:hypothetical protein FB45DRAFT_1056011 [Roridomyces roridus]